MNKLLIVLLAICLVSVHAFVKRDAPATEKNILKDMQEIGEKIAEGFKETFQPDAIKKNFGEFVDKANSLIAPNSNKPQQ